MSGEVKIYCNHRKKGFWDKVNQRFTAFSVLGISATEGRIAATVFRKLADALDGMLRIFHMFKDGL